MGTLLNYLYRVLQGIGDIFINRYTFARRHVWQVYSTPIVVFYCLLGQLKHKLHHIKSTS